ncbi:protein hook homolog [Saccostrea cucullata]|uniref:protein hook homolog n=1 Tax=Saccostrea cuccullata TaxID=36930 RepID=UPI002ED0A960
MSASGVVTRNSNSNSRKSTNSPISKKTSQTPNNNNQKQEKSEKASERPSEEMISIQTQLTEIRNDLKKSVKVDDIRDIIKNVVDLEELLSNHLKNFEKKMNDQIVQLKQDNQKLTHDIEKLKKENSELKRELNESNDALNDVHNRVEEVEKLSKSAAAKANFNEQYSRKTNIKFHGFPEAKDENLLEKINEALGEVGVAISETGVIAMHRIPSGQKDQPQPIIVKLRSTDAKATIMRKRSEIKELKQGWRVADDVTRDNAMLISRLSDDHRIDSAWYFNGAVYGQ